VRRTGRYGPQQSFAVAERDAELFEVAVGEVGEHVRVDLVVSKLLPVLTEAETAQPFADIHSRAPHGLPGYSLYRGAPSSGAVRSIQRRFDLSKGQPANGRFGA